MLEGLKRRFEQRKAVSTQREEQEQAQLAKMQRIVEQAGVMESLVEDTRYHDYKQLLEEAKDACQAQLAAMTLESAGGRDEYLHATGVLQGRILQLAAILTTPETFLSLAEQADTANGASRQLAPSHARIAPSAR